MKHLKLFALLALAVLAISCEKKEETFVTIKSDEAVAVSQEGDAVSIKFMTNAPWKAESSADWLTISPTSGEGVKGGMDFTIKASALKNDNTDSRTATVTITSGTLSKTVTVTQGQKDALEVDVLEYEVGQEGGTVEVEVNSNVEYNVSIPEAID